MPISLLRLGLRPVQLSPTLRLTAFFAATSLPAGLSAGSLNAQARSIDFTYGRWWRDDPAVTYTVALRRPLLGPFDLGLGVSHLDDSRSTIDRTQTGADVSIGLGRSGTGLYLVASTGLAMRHDDGNLDANWSAGGGYGLRLLSFLTLAIEGRYRVEDRGVQGFWRLATLDRRGFVLLARVGIGSGPPPPPPTPSASPSSSEPSFSPPSDREIRRSARKDGVSKESAALAADVVRTALEAMGSPYRWGGSDEEGYDCSGLIQYAYGEHGILLPRVSRDQTRTGSLIERAVTALRPGDILGFALTGGGVSHVGLYVGDGMFIHSASSGVKLSSLTVSDPDNRWWRDRWVTVRRVLN